MVWPELGSSDGCVVVWSSVGDIVIDTEGVAVGLLTGVTDGWLVTLMAVGIPEGRLDGRVVGVLVSSTPELGAFAGAPVGGNTGTSVSSSVKGGSAVVDVVVSMNGGSAVVDVEVTVDVEVCMT